MVTEEVQAMVDQVRAVMNEAATFKTGKPTRIKKTDAELLVLALQCWQKHMGGGLIALEIVDDLLRTVSKNTLYTHVPEVVGELIAKALDREVRADINLGETGYTVTVQDAKTGETLAEYEYRIEEPPPTASGGGLQA